MCVTDALAGVFELLPQVLEQFIAKVVVAEHTHRRVPAAAVVVWQGACD